MIERGVAAISFAFTSIGGIVAALMTLAMFTDLAKNENAGIESILEAFDKIEFAFLSIIGVSIVLGIIAIVISLVRMSSDKPKASPPGFTYLIAGLPNLISPLLIVYSWSIVVEVVAGRYVGDIAQAGARIAEIMIYAIICGIGPTLILPFFAFVPFNARRGRKLSSIIALSLVVVCIVAVAIAFLGVSDGLATIPPKRPI
jgi:hypothetical protein